MEFIIKYWWKLMVALAAAVITIGGVWTLSCEFSDTYVSADELKPVLTQVAANSREIKSMANAQERAALWAIYESTNNVISQIQNQWAGKQMPLKEQQRLQRLQFQLKQLELQLNK